MQHYISEGSGWRALRSISHDAGAEDESEKVKRDAGMLNMIPTKKGRAKRDVGRLIVDPTLPTELEGSERVKRDAGRLIVNPTT